MVGGGGEILWLHSGEEKANSKSFLLPPFLKKKKPIKKAKNRGILYMPKRATPRSSMHHSMAYRYDTRSSVLTGALT